ncbi:MAG: alpha/beta fold hydrolase [Bacteroidota bacterium]|nr:alpha/beta fold hydrolase [Bacteroidota bacterium]
MNVLHSNIIGSGDDHFIILHGFLGMGDNWKTHAKNLSEKEYCVHLVDQRNHGRSFWSDIFDYDVMVNDLLQYLNHHGINQCVVLGHSMGGKTAMAFALNYPDRVQKLIIADIAPKYYAPHHQRILAGLSTLNLEEVSSRKAAAEHLKNFIPEAGTRQFLLKNLYWVSEGKLGLRINVAVLKNAAEAVGAAIQSQKQYHQPTLFLYGENSNYINPMTDTEILKYFPKAEIIEIKGAGHWLHAEKPILFFKTLTQWLV